MPILSPLSSLSPMRIPSYLISGLNVAGGMLVVTLLAMLLGGSSWAVTASIGALITSMPDLPTRPSQKVRELMPATVLGAAFYLISLLAHPHPWWLAATILVGSFLAVLPQAWGKRGAPLSFSMMFGLVLPLAAPPIGHWSIALLDTALFIGGGLVYIGWSSQTAGWLDTRYRTLALADATEALARMLRLQARAIGEGVAPGSAPEVALGQMVLQQTAFADKLQTARDLVFNTLEKARHRQLASVLLGLVEVRDQLLTSQLDIDLLMKSRAGRDAVPALAALLDESAVAADAVTHTLRTGQLSMAGLFDAALDFATLRRRHQRAARRVARNSTVVNTAAVKTAAANARAQDMQAASAGPIPTSEVRASARAAAANIRVDNADDSLMTTVKDDEGDSVASVTAPSPSGRFDSHLLVENALRDRLTLLLTSVQDMSAALADPTRSPPLTAEDLQLFVSPTTWSWKYLRERLVWRSPIFRFGLRTAMAMGVAYLIAVSLPWAAHKHWILVSVAVVLRSTYAQSSERRRMRLIGTAVGCLISAVLLGITDDRGVLFLVLIAAAGTGHAFAGVHYAVTSTAGSVMGLLQTHMLAPLGGFVVWERLADTILGIALAFAFSFVLPSWERHQIPGLVRRVLQSQARHVKLTLAELATPSKSPVEWRLARREVYDALAALVQGVQRMQGEPRQVRLPVPAVASLVKHGQELLAHMAAVKTLLTLRRDSLHEPEAGDAVARAGAAMDALLDAPVVVDPVGPTPRKAPLSPLPQPDWPLLPPTDQRDLTPWLQRRLAMAEVEARQLVEAARPILKAVEAEPQASDSPVGGSPTAGTAVR